MTANRLMPRYRPARSEQFQPMTPLTATQAAVAEPALYSETDICKTPPRPPPSPKPTCAMKLWAARFSRYNPAMAKKKRRRKKAVRLIDGKNDAEPFDAALSVRRAASNSSR